MLFSMCIRSIQGYRQRNICYVVRRVLILISSKSGASLNSNMHVAFIIFCHFYHNVNINIGKIALW